MNTDYRQTLAGTGLDYFDAQAAVDALAPGAWARLPYTARVHAENLVRRADPAQLPDYLRQLIERRRDIDFPWFPVRVVCHDILGQTALVDLAGLRDAIAQAGGDPAAVNPVVPVQLIVDHSLAVECGGFDPEAFEKNRAIEDRRNEDRFHFIEWSKKAFANVDVIPAGNGIMHQINLEKMSPVVYVQDGVAFPDTCVGTDSHTPHVDALGVIAVGVGGLEAENVMLGRASWMRLPDIVGVALSGRPQPGITATDIVLALTEFLRQQKVVGAYVEFYGEGARSLSIGDRATIANMCPEYGATAALFAVDEQTLAYLRLTGRDEKQVQLVETYAKTAGFWADSLAQVSYERVLQFDLSTVVRNMAGPSNPHRRLPTSQLAERGIAIIYISHRMAEIFEHCDRITVMRDGCHIRTENIADISPEEVVNSMVGRVLDKLYPSKLSDDEKSDDVILSVRGLNEGKRVFDVGFDLRRGEILGLAGLIGAGRSEIARAVCRLEGKPTGEVMLRGRRLGLKDYRDSIREGIVYLSEDRKGDGLFLNMSIAANVSALDIGRISNGMGFIERRKEMKRADELGRRLKLRANSVGDSVSTLSGGNQQKVALAKMLSVEPKVIFLDEPTRGVDVGAKAEIHRQIRELAREGVGVVVISSELPELIGVSDRVLVVREGRITGEVEGDDMTEEKIMQLASITIMQNAAEA